MRKKVLCIGLMTAMLLLCATAVFASEVNDTQIKTYGTTALAIVIGMGLAAFGTGVGMGNAINGAVSGVARNPESFGRILTAMMIGLAMIESLAIYTLVLCFMLMPSKALLGL